MVRRPARRNLHGALAGLHVKEVRTLIGRIEIVLGQDDALPEVRDRAVACLRHRQLLGGHARAARLRGHGRGDRVAAAAEGIGRTVFACSSAAPIRSSRRRRPISRAISDRACGHARGWKVDLDHADLVIRVEIIPGAAFCYIGREQGTGGLPTGTGGRAGRRCCPAASTRRSRRGA